MVVLELPRLERKDHRMVSSHGILVPVTQQPHALAESLVTLSLPRSLHAHLQVLGSTNFLKRNAYSSLVYQL